MKAPTLAELIHTARTSESPTEREYAVRTAYLMGAVDAIDRKANATFDALGGGGTTGSPSFAHSTDPSVRTTRVAVQS